MSPAEFGVLYIVVGAYFVGAGFAWNLTDYTDGAARFVVSLWWPLFGMVWIVRAHLIVLRRFLRAVKSDRERVASARVVKR